MGTCLECHFNSDPCKRYIFSLFHYRATPCPNFDQLLANFGSQLWSTFGQLPEPALSQLVDLTLFNCWLNFWPMFVNCWELLESNCCNVGANLELFEKLLS